jgi:hypothetical protein
MAQLLLAGADELIDTALGFVGSPVVKNVMKTRLISTEEEISHIRSRSENHTISRYA